MARNRTKAERKRRRIADRTEANAKARLAMQSQLASDEPNPPPQVVRLRQSPLDRYYQRGVLGKLDSESEKELAMHRYKAGIDFGYDFERARIIGPSPVRAAVWEVRSSSAKSELTELEVARFQRYQRAVRKLGKHLSPLVEAVCAYGETCEEWASRQPNMSRQDATALLRHGLLILAEHYEYRREDRVRPCRNAQPSAVQHVHQH